MTDVLSSRAYTVIGGDHGEWSVVSQRTLLGAPVENVARIDMVSGMLVTIASNAVWALRGVATNDRYTTRVEKIRTG